MSAKNVKHKVTNQQRMMIIYALASLEYRWGPSRRVEERRRLRRRPQRSFQVGARLACYRLAPRPHTV